MSYLVLARKYRSTTFDEVVGQEPIARTLVNSLRTGRIAHAYLFTGTRGVGKTTMARILAKALNCLKADAPTPEPCGECDACLGIARGDDMDVIEIDGASNRGIEQIRELRANAIFRPARCRYKIYYIDEVHMLTREAFNSLLKTLEEPPEHVKFVFATTEPEKLPATIISRCQRFDFRNIPTPRIAEHLRTLCEAEGAEADDDALFRIARAAAGSMRDGLSLLEQLLAGGGRVTDDEVIRVLGTPPDERVLAIGSAIAEGDAPAALGELDAVLAAGVTLVTAAGAMGDCFRNLLIASTCGGDSELIELPETQRKAVAELAERFSTPVLVQAVGVLETAARNARYSSAGRVLVEAAVIRLAQAEKFVDPQSILKRLEALSGRGRPSGAPAPQKKKPPPPVGRGGRQSRRPAPEAQRGSPRPGARRPPQEPRRRPAPKRDEPPGRYEPAPEPEAAKPPAPQRSALNTAEKNAVAQDPAVREVVGLFGGDVVDVVAVPHAGAADEEDARANEDAVEGADDVGA